MMQLKIHDQSMTMLMMQTKNSKKAPGASNQSLHVLEIHDQSMTMLTSILARTPTVGSI